MPFNLHFPYGSAKLRGKVPLKTFEYGKKFRFCVLKLTNYGKIGTHRHRRKEP